MSFITRRNLLKHGAAGVAAGLAMPRAAFAAASSEPVNVGVLQSLTGGMSIIETTMRDGVLLAVSEINAAGGVLGRKINPIVEDGATDPKVFADKASKLVIQDDVQVIFGAIVSAVRKAIIPIVERRNRLYFYPALYEGNECSRNVIYTGAVINQIAFNSVPWAVNTLGKKKVFIVGSNFVYSRETAKVIKILLGQLGAEWVADEYLEFGSSETASLVNKIKNSDADIVISNIVGDSVIAFYREYKNQGITQDRLPILSTVTSEVDIAALGPEYAVGSYTSVPYFQSIDTPENIDFIKRYREFVKNPNAVTHPALEASYFQVYLWKQAVEKAGSFSADGIRENIRGQETAAPNGTVRIDEENLHAWYVPRIGQWDSNGQAKIVDVSPAPVRPLPYAAYGETDSNLFCTSRGLDRSKLKG